MLILPGWVFGLLIFLAWSGLCALWARDWVRRIQSRNQNKENQ